ncbi:MAG: tRNA pseudouridine(38-40) synthase TruA [Candidatus Methanoperedens sp.]|nr:tRNA pseudouridine(38-40) synthase TruA [Candidatus Methanoperedens sp.]MCE8424328.1 tRNA pseudouridine(38-40) synthase TruA [Candidatus Methanoperedens sp.]MCE8427661.1 tRNA pseudouridine(38-40) synthase TruA [Candidatus Methanoperedens sp.]
MRIALKFAYLGTEYHGFQKNPGVPTIEGKLLKVLKDSGAIRNPSRARYSAAGRTDRGVHAIGQVIAFDPDNQEASMPRALNSALSHIWVYAWAEVGADFNARRSAMEREYRYMLWGQGLDIEKIREASTLISGRHDFRNFAEMETGKTTECDVRAISIEEQGNWIYIDISANRFVYHMVRKLSTALKLIGKCEKDKEWLKKMLACTLNERIEPLSAHGLVFKNISYPDVKWNIDTYARDSALLEMHELFMRTDITARMLEAICEAIDK